MVQELLPRQSELSLPAPEAAALGYLATNSTTITPPPPMEHFTVAAAETIAPEQSAPAPDRQTFTDRVLHAAEGLGRLGLLPEVVGLAAFVMYRSSHRKSASSKYTTTLAA